MDNEVINHETCPTCKGAGSVTVPTKKTSVVSWVRRCGLCGGTGSYHRFGIMGTGAVWDMLITACAGRYRVAVTR